jgi:hypothetical protein
MICAGLDMGLPAMGWAGRSVGCSWGRLGCDGHWLWCPRAGQATGWAGLDMVCTGLGWSWVCVAMAGLPMSWDIHGLGWP